MTINPPIIYTYVVVSNGKRFGVAEKTSSSIIVIYDTLKEAKSQRDKWNLEEHAKLGEWKVVE